MNSNQIILIRIFLQFEIHTLLQTSSSLETSLHLKGANPLKTLSFRNIRGGQPDYKAKTVHHFI